MKDNPEIKADWNELAVKVGSIQKDGNQYSSTRHAQDALELILGKDFFRNAVDFYVSGRPGAELARSVLWHLTPWTAMQRCHEIYQTRSNAEEKSSAIELLRVCADVRVLPWVEEYLSDENKGVQLWGAGVVDQLLWKELVDFEECESLLSQMKTHTNEQVREMYQWIISFLKDREVDEDEDLNKTDG